MILIVTFTNLFSLNLHFFLIISLITIIYYHVFYLLQFLNRIIELLIFLHFAKVNKSQFYICLMYEINL